MNNYIILGNGFTIDFLKNFQEYQKGNRKQLINKIDVTNLFSKGDQVTLPDNNSPGFLSYKMCPNLWTLGATPSCSDDDSKRIVEEVTTCSNMFFDFLQDPKLKSKRLALSEEDNQSIYIKAYSELIVYLKHLFCFYNDQIEQTELVEYVKNSDWGWINYFNRIRKELNNTEIIIVTYNYDIWLERVLDAMAINYYISGIERKRKNAIQIIKPHGSISFDQKETNNIMLNQDISYKLNLDGVTRASIRVNRSHNLLGNRNSILIPPAGDSIRMSISSWTIDLRATASDKALNTKPNDNVILCGISYWHVDRRELDEIFLNLDSNVNMTFINPSPPCDLNAVLMSIFKNYRLLKTSNDIGGILNGKNIE